MTAPSNRMLDSVPQPSPLVAASKALGGRDVISDHVTCHEIRQRYDGVRIVAISPTNKRSIVYLADETPLANVRPERGSLEVTRECAGRRVVVHVVRAAP